MKLQLIATQRQERTVPRVKPIDHFKKCPSRGCKELIDVSPDVLCSDCNWESTVWDVSRGAMDNIFGAAKEFGFQIMEQVEGGQVVEENVSAQVYQPMSEVAGA